MSVIIIEAPNKCEKIAHITKAKVFATKGHFKQLAEEEWLNFDSYEPKFDFMCEKKKSIDHIVKECKGEDVFIATDPDREGYAIGYMFYELVKNIAKSIKRVEFHEITESGIKKGLDSSIPFNQTNTKFYEAFKARVVGDKLVGFILSPKLSKLLEIKGMSAGRVQTPALKLIVDRENEIIKYEFNIKVRAFFSTTKEIKYFGFKNVFLQEEEDEETGLQNLVLNLKEMDSVEIQNFEIKEIKKKAPHRFKESEFIPLLQKLGIGRPSTYHTFVPKLLEREYIQINSKGKKQELVATSRGKLAIQTLQKEDEWITQSEFTSQMEKILDLITNGESQYIDFVKTLHERLGFKRIEKRERKPPTIAQIQLMEKLSNEHNIPIPEIAREEMQECSKWLENAFREQPPSLAQIKFAEDIFKKTGIPLPKNYKESAQVCKKYIEKNKNKLSKTKDKK